MCRKYPGARALVVRKTRESLTETVLVTWERDVLGPDHPILTSRPSLRRVRQSYQFPNASVVVLGGMDKPDKVLSSEWDLVYVPEATELDLVDWETLGGRLRAGAVPYQQIIADCKRDRDKGIEALQARFDPAEDGRPRIFFREGAREYEADPVSQCHGYYGCPLFNRR